MNEMKESKAPLIADKADAKRLLERSISNGPRAKMLGNVG